MNASTTRNAVTPYSISPNTTVSRRFVAGHGSPCSMGLPLEPGMSSGHRHYQSHDCLIRNRKCPVDDSETLAKLLFSDGEGRIDEDSVPPHKRIDAVLAEVRIDLRHRA